MNRDNARLNSYALGGADARHHHLPANAADQQDGFGRETKPTGYFVVRFRHTLPGSYVSSQAGASLAPAHQDLITNRQFLLDFIVAKMVTSRIDLATIENQK
ncbi:hypothetical protein [Mesorhizobium sp. M7A.F.Ca.MR.148.00.0.0]|uniref:hypothetical protein n=1 Tax=Mesorhizobium sp. M7A.F.Ca.MR.148.00.0.0 TaxID=2496775 RepID=UPI0013E2C57F|nr:hypothetical protein [Mesorhizobium sp. M7A.F.Ca.MR.148.00.0.0]